MIKGPGFWLALAEGATTRFERRDCRVGVVDAGVLPLPSGKLSIDDRVLVGYTGEVLVPRGKHPVKITTVDHRGRPLNAFVSFLFDRRAEEAGRCFLSERGGVLFPAPGEQVSGVVLDTGTLAAVDSDLTKDWEDVSDILFEPEENHERVTTQDGVVALIVRSGWGDGFCPLIGGFDSRGRLVALHLDFRLLEPDESAPAPPPGLRRLIETENPAPPEPVREGPLDPEERLEHWRDEDLDLQFLYLRFKAPASAQRDPDYMERGDEAAEELRPWLQERLQHSVIDEPDYLPHMLRQGIELHLTCVDVEQALAELLAALPSDWKGVASIYQAGNRANRALWPGSAPRWQRWTR